MKNIKSNSIYQLFLLFLTIFILEGCTDTEDFTPLSSSALVLIPTVSNEASIIESASDGYEIPLTLSSKLTEKGTIKVKLSSTDGTTYGKDYTSSPEAGENGIVMVPVSAGAEKASLKIIPILDPKFNSNKKINLKLSNVDGGLILGKHTEFTLTIINKPIIEVDKSELAFGAVESGSLPVQSYKVTGYGLLGDIQLSTQTGFLLSLDNSTYKKSITIASSSAEQTPVTVYTQFIANTNDLGEKSGVILHFSDSADDASVSLKGKEIKFSDFAFSGFEDVNLDGLSVKYTKSGTETLDNNNGEAPVDFTATGSEMGFDTSFDAEHIGDDDKESLGVGAVANLSELYGNADLAFSYHGGSQGYHASDLDGTLEIVFDEVTFAEEINHLEFSVAVFLYSFEDNFDEGEGVELVWRTSEGDTKLIDVEDIAGDGNFTVNGSVAFAMNAWKKLTANIDVSESGNKGQVVVRIYNDNNRDVYLVDDIAIKTSK